MSNLNCKIKLTILSLSCISTVLFQNCSDIGLDEIPKLEKFACSLNSQVTLPYKIEEVTTDLPGYHKFVVIEKSTNLPYTAIESRRLIDWSFDKYINGVFQKTVEKGSSQYLYLKKGEDTDGEVCVQRHIKAKVKVCTEILTDFPEVIVEHNCEPEIPEIPDEDEVPDLNPPPPAACQSAWSYGRTRQSNIQYFEDAFPFGEWPYSGASSDGVGSSSPISVKRGKYIAIKFTPYLDLEQGIGVSQMISMIEAQGAIAPATGVFVSLSRCPGDARPPNNSADREDVMLASGCRKYGGTLNIGYGVSQIEQGTTTTCVLRPNQPYYLNIFLLDPRDGVTDDEHTCAVNSSTDEKFEECGKRFKFN